MCFWIKHKAKSATMIIGKKILVEPVSLNLSGDAGMNAIFLNRSLLHEKKIPAFTVYICESVWNAFLQKAADEYTSKNNEASGIILGHYFKDIFGEYVVGTHFEAGNGSGTSSVFCEISVQDQIRILQVAKEKKLLQIIWIHSHPSFGAFYSSVDYRTLKSMYYAPHQAGIVVDNVKSEYLGFKVRNSNAYEYKDIFLVNLDSETNSLSFPFGKSASKIFYANSNGSHFRNKKINEPLRLKSLQRQMIQEKSTDMLPVVQKLLEELKSFITTYKESDAGAMQYRQNWEKKISEIEYQLTSRYGEKPYKDVAVYFNKLNEMRLLLNKGTSPANQAILEDKLNDLLNYLPK